MNTKSFFVSATLLTIIGLAIWTTMLSMHPTLTKSTIPSSLPDAYMEDVTALIMNKEGKLTLKIETPQLTHYKENDKTDFIEPTLTLFKESVQPWHITAKFAQATQGIDNVSFWDHVNIHHAADKNHPDTQINTASLTVHPNLKTAETRDLITMVQPDLKVNAIGMHANMNTGDVVLLSQAKGEYAPNS